MTIKKNFTNPILFCIFTQNQTVQKPLQILKEYWGYDEFLFPQQDIIESILNGNDCLAILPTGGGKSLCYQIPAMILDGITIVVSPLIALMQDQIQNLNSRGIPAESISSQLSHDEIAVVISRCTLGKVKLLYIAPERLQSNFFLEALQNLPVKLIAIDEAHCIAQWGFDFRPSYLKIHLLREMFPNINFIALTATAPPKTANEIIETLKLKTPEVFIKSLKRENLTYRVIHSQNELDDLVYELKKNPGSGIVFVRTRKKTFEVARFIKKKEINDDYFHAKLKKKKKKKKQKIWTESPDQIMVSTNAFGMGIDKPDVRTVIHLNMPDSLEAYVQEAGRAGRDGEKSVATLFLQPYEVEDLEGIFKSSLPSKSEFEQIEKMFYNFFEIGENERPEESLEFNLTEFINRFNLNKKKTEKTLQFLERKELIAFKKYAAYSKVRVYSNPRKIEFSKSIQSQILESLVRKYPGILSDEKSIVEFHIAVDLQKDVKKIKRQLQKMSDAGYINYNSKDIQYVNFKRPRESNYIKNNLWREFEQLQITKWKRLQDMIYYAVQSENCREKLILRYFGEKPVQKCGCCDICHHEIKEIELDLLIDYLTDNSKSIHEIINHFVKYSKENILEKLEFLIDEGIVKNTGIDSYTKI